MQTEPIKEMLITGAGWYGTIGISLFIACIMADLLHHHNQVKNGESDKGFPFFISVMFYGYFSAIWLPYALHGLYKKITKKEYS